MKKIVICLVVFFSFINSFSQDAARLVTEGVVLHDEAKYEEALKKFDEAISIDKEAYMAYYEKSYTLFVLKKYDECIDLSRYILKNFKDNSNNASVYINYGTCLDLQGKPKKALDIYDEGIKYFPGVGLLHFNKAITLVNMNEAEEGLKSIFNSVTHNPYHASSHNVLSIVVSKQNKIYGLLASLVFLAIEPEGKRADHHFKNVQAILGANVTKTGDNAVTINLDPSILDDKKKKKENDFSSLELMMSMSSALNYDEKYKDETMVERMKRNLELVFSMLDAKKGKGFGWTYYAPFFVQLKKADYMETFCHIIATSSADQANNTWLQENKDKVSEFNSWFRNYWIKKG